MYDAIGLHHHISKMEASVGDQAHLKREAMDPININAHFSRCVKIENGAASPSLFVGPRSTSFSFVGVGWSCAVVDFSTSGSWMVSVGEISSGRGCC